MKDEYAPLRESSTRSVYIRSWKPGDGLICSFARMAKATPCGAPVAVTLTEERLKCWRDWCKGDCSQCNKAVRRAVCRNHIPGLYSSGEVNLEARKAAAERLAVAHWDEYRQYLTEETQTRREKAFEFADPEIRRIILGASTEPTE